MDWGSLGRHTSGPSLRTPNGLAWPDAGLSTQGESRGTEPLPNPTRIAPGVAQAACSARAAICPARIRT
jgi:hypothetical protein